jgi:hypothetical protein
MKKSKRAAPTPRYQVTMAASPLVLPKNGAAIGFTVKNGSGHMLGRIEVGQGTIRWWKNNAKTRPTRKLTWAEFAAQMNERRP